MHTRTVGAVVALSVLFATVSAEAREAARPLAEMTLVAGHVAWELAGDYEHLVLTVTGPEGFWLRKEFAPGQSPSLNLFEQDGQRLPEGAYVYELRLQAREGDPERPVLQAGAFAVREGGFAATLERPRKGSAKEPPVRHITAASEEVVADNLVVQGNACIGDGCGTGDADGPPLLRLKSTVATGIFFEDVTDGLTYDRDWLLQANPTIGGPDHFFLRDVDASTTPFSVQGDAPTSSLVVTSTGKIGLGTTTPGSQLHLYQDNTSDAIVGMGPDPVLGPAFNVGYGGTSFGRGSGFLNVRPDASASAPNPSLRLMTVNVERMIITNAGNIGMGTSAPSTQLHVRDTGTRGKILAENASGTTAARELMEIRNNGNADFILDDTSVTERWAITAGSSLVQNNTANAGSELVLSNTGNLTIAGTLTENSDRDSKRDIVPIQPEEILAKVASLPIATWNRKLDSPSVRHLGPMAQDFAAVFGLGGGDDRHIAVLDMAGVSLASIQALYQMTTRKDEEIAQLRRENADLAQRLAALEALVLRDRKEERPALPPAP